MRNITHPRFFLVSAAISLVCLTACNSSGQNAAAQTTAAQTTPEQTTPATEVADSNPASGNLAPVADAAPATDPQTDPQYGTDLPVDAQQYPADYAYDTTTPIETTEPPPPLPVYNQPPCPGDDYYWTPGYWAWTDGGYYWVPGAWVLAPWVDALWTPPYWGFTDGYYRWHPGYWGTHIGFYGGIDYGFGYIGTGFYGAYWNHDRLFYNRNVTNVDPDRVHNFYNYGVPRGRDSHISYNGGRGGISARPTPQEMAVARDPRTPPVTAQVEHARQAASNRSQFAARGNARPSNLVASAPLHTTYHAPAARPPAAAVRAAQNHAAPQARPETRPTPQRAAAPTPQARPEARPRPETRPTPQRAAAPTRQARPENRPTPQRAAVPTRQARPENRPTPQRAAAPTRQTRPEARPTPQRAAAPQPQARPTPQRAAAPTRQARPENRPTPQRAAAPRPENRPARVAARPEAPRAEIPRGGPPAHSEAPGKPDEKKR